MNRAVKGMNPNRIIEAIGSRWFLVVVITFFVLGAGWLAYSLNTQGSYDEMYHLAIISAYKSHISPFITVQLPSYDVVGDITRLPSYFYHYLMSWPARGIALFTSDFHIQVFLLRLINIGFFAASLLIYRKILRLLGLGKVSANASIFFITLIPLSVQLSSTVNYDNLLFLVSGATIYLFIKMITAKKVTYTSIVAFFSIGMLGALIKYTFLPLYAPLFVFAGVVIVRRDRHHIWRHIVESGKEMLKHRRMAFLGLASVLVLSSGLFIERYGVNLAKYHAITPKCEVLMEVDRCAEYYVWQRNNTLYNTKNEHPIDTDVFVYFGQWLKGMSTTPFFPQLIVDDVGNPLGPLPLPVRVFQVLVVIGFVMLLVGYNFITRNKARLFVFLAASFYVLVLFADNYNSYLTYHIPVATSGRYLLVVLPLLIGLSVFVINAFSSSRKYLLLGIGTIVVVFMLQGGGVMTDIMRGQPSWFWNRNIYMTNVAIKHIAEPFIKEREW